MLTSGCGRYSNLALSHDKDKLPALSGLARSFQPHRPGRYLAGLWEDTFLTDMLWTAICKTKREDPHPWTVPRPSEWCGPSWSWASVRRVEYLWLTKSAYMDDGLFCPYMDPDARLVRAECVLAGDDPTGGVTEASAVLEGWSFKGAYRFLSPDQFQVLPRCFTFLPDCDLRERNGGLGIKDGHPLLVLRLVVKDRDSMCLVLRKLGEQYERIGFLDDTRIRTQNYHWQTKKKGQMTRLLEREGKLRRITVI